MTGGAVANRVFRRGVFHVGEKPGNPVPGSPRSPCSTPRIPGRDRTCNLSLRSAALFLLSYRDRWVWLCFVTGHGVAYRSGISPDTIRHTLIELFRRISFTSSGRLNPAFLYFLSGHSVDRSPGLLNSNVIYPGFEPGLDRPSTCCLYRWASRSHPARRSGSDPYVLLD